MDNNPRNSWYDQRLSLEQGHFLSAPDGPFRKRKWASLDPALKLFEQVLRLSGLHGRGVNNAKNVSLKPITFQLPNLPAAFDGYRILQISDPHLDLLPDLSERIVSLLGGISVDLLLLTGDYRDRHDAAPETGLAILRPVLAAVDAPDGKIAILGNHDPAAAVPILEDMGLRVLLNQTIAIQRCGESLHLTSLDDVHSFYTDAAHRALQETVEGCRIAAVHSAEVADLAAAAGIDLYLCGHTHGGQIRLPWGGPPVRNLRRCRDYSHGQWRHGAMQGYTSNGAGVATIPIRYNCPAEVALITLRRPG
ncbi:MAG: metallophosphoesterase [Alphaproteobacteria bacterium]|nr:metallophosphoesterase [Alphaproteobacteria bacterium]MDP6829957.1 metallophosphoesterase [Alphaproteobacteria bacterium]